MKIFEPYLSSIDDMTHRSFIQDILEWVHQAYPELEPVIKWNQPMFQHHGTFIIGFSISKQHISVAPENVTMEKFSDDISEAGYSQTKGLFRIKYKDVVNYELLKSLIDFNIEDKKDYHLFWRK